MNGNPIDILVHELTELAKGNPEWIRIDIMNSSLELGIYISGERAVGLHLKQTQNPEQVLAYVRAHKPDDYNVSGILRFLDNIPYFNLSKIPKNPKQI